MEKQYLQREIKFSVKKKEDEIYVIKSMEDAYEYIERLYGPEIDVYETAYIILLKRDNSVIGWYKISHGGVSQTVIDAKIITKVAIDTLASAVIIAHNHPSGETNPSIQDDNVTENLKKCLKLFEIELLDSIIIGDGKFYSYKLEGRL